MDVDKMAVDEETVAGNPGPVSHLDESPEDTPRASKLRPSSPDTARPSVEMDSINAPVAASSENEKASSTEKPPIPSSPRPAPDTTTSVPFEATPMIVDEGIAPPRSGRPSPVDPQSYAPMDRPLNVTDALSYLDAVKVQFQDQPDVYNHFLDIMKEFKNELIDTPGVIKRVSHLFNGHPSLIQGFNTFLPAGYRIECSTDAHDANYITVTTPSGTTMQTTNNGPGRGPILWSTTTNGANLSRPGTAVPVGFRSSADQGPASPDPRLYGVDGQAMEPAVQYVQKIKQRCDPETYRQFLDILSRYYHKPDAIDEGEILRQIARLFKDSPDLRDDFRVFMPDKSQQWMDENVPLAAPTTRTGTPTDGRSRRKLDVVANAASNAAATNGSALPLKRKRKPVEKEKEKDATAKAAAPPVKKPKLTTSQDLTPLSYNPKHNTGPSSPRRVVHHAQLPPVASRSSGGDETRFFDRVKQALDSREIYNEFLKIVNLFTQDYIDVARLIRESQHFLGDTELLRQFKEILGWDEKKERDHFLAERQPQSAWTRPTAMHMRSKPGRVDLNVAYGSYRKVSANEANVTCSGRDEMCRSVLNDEWVSHPSWSSEESGFIAHKKNIYEEALHRSEEERHEYDFHIEAIVRTITMLEPINNKIAQLNPDERPTFKLKANLGGSCKAIHQRVIKKIYGREPGLEVLQSMQETPALAIPLVLQRLKQKEEEWKRAQREWNKVWREVDARNYIKSLDHQAISFKTADKRTIITKYFVNQIEAAREEQMTKRASLIDPLFARTRPRHQLEYTVDNVQVLQDAMKLTFSFLDRTQAQINFTERKRIEGFLRSLVPLFFNLEPVAFNSAFVVIQQETQESDMSDDGRSTIDDTETVNTPPSVGRPRNRKNGNGISSGGDLRKKLLKSEQAKSTNRKTRAQASPAVSRLASPALLDDEARPEGSQIRRFPRKNIFFANTTFYSLLRLIELLYSRLRRMKDTAASIAAQGPASRRLNNLSAQAEAERMLGERSANADHFYELMLESCERLFDNEIEQHAFEDQMRFMFGLEAYKVFTVDKLVGAIIKQVQAVFPDPRSQELLEILKKERALTSPTTQDLINARRNAEKVLGPDENLFRIDWLSDSKTMTVQLIGDDTSFDDSEVLTGRWQRYIDSYVASEYTEGVAQSKVKRPFLRRHMPPGIKDTQPDVSTQDGLEIKVCVRTYRLFFVSHTEDFLWKYRTKEEVDKNAQHLKSRNTRRRKWLDDAKASPSPS